MRVCAFGSFIIEFLVASTCSTIIFATAIICFRCMCAAHVSVAPAVGAVPLCLWLVPRWHRLRCDVCLVCWFKLMGPIGIILSARHKHSTPAGRSNKCGVLVRCICSSLAARLQFVVRVALLVCVGGLTFIACVCAFGDFLLYFRGRQCRWRASSA